MTTPVEPRSDPIAVTVSHVGVRPSRTSGSPSRRPSLPRRAKDVGQQQSQPDDDAGEDDERHDPHRHRGKDRAVRRIPEPIRAAKVPSLGANTGSSCAMCCSRWPASDPSWMSLSSHVGGWDKPLRWPKPSLRVFGRAEPRPAAAEEAVRTARLPLPTRADEEGAPDSASRTGLADPSVRLGGALRKERPAPQHLVARRYPWRLHIREGDRALMASSWRRLVRSTSISSGRFVPKRDPLQHPRRLGEPTPDVHDEIPSRPASL